MSIVLGIVGWILLLILTLIASAFGTTQAGGVKAGGEKGLAAFIGVVLLAAIVSKIL